LFSHIKNQHKCKSCYITAALNAIEGLHAKEYKEYIHLSSQEIIDCDKRNRGCKGGLPSNVADYVSTYGISMNNHYRYIARSSGDCRARYFNNRTKRRSGPRILEQLLSGSLNNHHKDLKQIKERKLQRYNFYSPYGQNWRSFFNRNRYYDNYDDYDDYNSNDNSSDLTPIQSIF
jgi:hypothetical protein